MTHCREDTIDRFAALHLPALARNEARHNMMLALIGRARADEAVPTRLWTLGGPGACAVRAGTHNILIGDADEAQCAALAEATRGLDAPGVVGPDDTARWYADAAGALGTPFSLAMRQRIHSLDHRAAYPGAPGAARPVGAADADLLHRWFTAFCAEAVPNDPPPSEALSRSIAARGSAFFWEADGAPVAMAAQVRESDTTGTISLVYTPPGLRGRGFGGSVTAAVCDHIFAAGKRLACLYTDLRNPWSNRAYEKIGFRPVCDALYYRRDAQEET